MSDALFFPTVPIRFSKERDFRGKSVMWIETKAPITELDMSDLKLLHQFIGDFLNGTN